MTDYIKVISNKLNDICDFKAPNIPILPEVVNNDVVKNYLGNIKTIPVGVEKETLKVATVDLGNSFMYNITGEDITSNPEFIRGIINNCLTVKNSEFVIFDSITLLEDMTKDNVTYSTDACYKSIDKLTELVGTTDPDKTIFAMIIGVNSIMNKLSAIEKGKLQKLIMEAKTKNNIKVLIVENIDIIKSINFEPWYKGNADLSEGVWLGNGIGNQFTLKVTTNSRLLRAEVEPGFGYCIRKGRASLIKLMSDE